MTRRLERDLLAAGHRLVRVATRLMAAARAQGRSEMYWSSLNVLVVCPFGLITVAFAMLYWAIGTTANFEGGLSRANASISC